MNARGVRRTLGAALALVVLMLLGPLGVPTAVGQGMTTAVPVATVSDFDCARLRAEIVLDNSRSWYGVTYTYGGSFVRPLHAPFSGAYAPASVQVPARATQVVELPLTKDARTTVVVHLPDGGDVTSTGACGDAPNAVFSASDCDALRLGLTLDNRDSTRPTRFRWTQSDAAGLVASSTVDVRPGAVRVVDVPLVDDGRTWVEAVVDGRGRLATSDWRTCGRVVLNPRATFGELDCSGVSAPVTLDNARSTSRVRYHLPDGREVVLRPGETRALLLHLPIVQRVAVTADWVLADGLPVDLAALTTARCSRTSPVPLPASPGSAGIPTQPATVAGAVRPAASGVRPWQVLVVAVLGLGSVTALLLVVRPGRRPARPRRAHPGQ